MSALHEEPKQQQESVEAKFELFWNTQAKDLLSKNPKPIVRLYSHEKIETAFKRLDENGIISAPVFENEQFVGIIDVLDLVKFLIDGCGEVEPISSHSLEDKIHILQERAATWPINHLFNTGQRTSYFTYFPIFEDLPLHKLFHKLSCGNKRNEGYAQPQSQGLAQQQQQQQQQQPISSPTSWSSPSSKLRPFTHSCPLLRNDTSEMTSMLSQSRCVEFLNDNIDQLRLIFDGARPTVSQLALVQQQQQGGGGEGDDAICKVAADSKVFEALMKLQENRVNGLAVVDDQGKLVMNLSASDFRGVLVDDLPKLNLSVKDFIKSFNKFRRPICCSSDATFEDVIAKLASERVHRIWVVDDERKPIGVITLTDVMRVISSRIHGYFKPQKQKQQAQQQQQQQQQQTKPHQQVDAAATIEAPSATTV